MLISSARRGDRADGQAAADPLAQAGDVGLEAEALCRAALGEAEHQAVVEHEQHSRLAGELAQRGEEALGRRRDHARVLHRLDDRSRRPRRRWRSSTPVVAVEIAEGCERDAPRDLALALQPDLEVVVGAVIAMPGLDDQLPLGYVRGRA